MSTTVDCLSQSVANVELSPASESHSSTNQAVSTWTFSERYDDANADPLLGSYRNHYEQLLSSAQLTQNIRIEPPNKRPAFVICTDDGEPHIVALHCLELDGDGRLLAFTGDVCVHEDGMMCIPPTAEFRLRWLEPCPEAEVLTISDFERAVSAEEYGNVLDNNNTAAIAERERVTVPKACVIPYSLLPPLLHERLCPLRAWNELRNRAARLGLLTECEPLWAWLRRVAMPGNNNVPERVQDFAVVDTDHSLMCSRRNLLRQLLPADTATVDRRSAPSSVHDQATPQDLQQGNLLYDQLFVFQAQPLAFESKAGTHPIDILDHKSERRMIRDALNDARRVGAEIDVVFETATKDRFMACLQTGECKVLHISCHGGDTGYLAFEDEQGGFAPVFKKDFGDMLKLFDKLHFVFLAACSSETVGKAFIDAGVPHVLCCRRETQASDEAMIVFSRSFYRSIASKLTLQKAFEAGKCAVALSDQVRDAKLESEKFILLPPDDGNHNIPVFYPVRQNCRRHHIPTVSRWSLPHPPKPFIGRQIDAYKIVRALLKRDRNFLVRVTGCSGVGKTSVAAFVCQYLELRKEAYSIGDNIWLPLRPTDRNDEIASAFRRLSTILRNGNFPSSEFDTLCGTIINFLTDKKAIVTFEQPDLDRVRLRRFLQDITDHNGDVKIMLESSQEFNAMTPFTAQLQLKVDCLTPEDTAKLFGKLCKYVSTEPRYKLVTSPTRLTKLLMPLGDMDDEIFGIIGSGIPGKIVHAAQGMQEDQFDKLIDTGRRIFFSEYEKLREHLREAVTHYTLGEDMDEKVNKYLGYFDAARYLLLPAKDFCQDLSSVVFTRDFDELEIILTEANAFFEELKIAVIEKCNSAVV